MYITLFVYSFLTLLFMFSVGCALVLLLQQSDLLLKEPQRIAAVTLLYALYKGESMALNPFASVFVHLLVRLCMVNSSQNYADPIAGDWQGGRWETCRTRPTPSLIRS